MRQRMQGQIWLLCLFGLLTAGNVNAAFITDKIVVEVRTERFGQGAVLKKLSSGASVEVLMSDGKYTRVRTTDNVTGWVASTFLTNKKPSQLEYLELLAKSKTTEAKLRVAQQQLASGGGATAPPTSVDDEEIERLKDEAKNARWMKVEMQKARDRAEQAEAKLKAKGKKSGDSKKELESLRSKNKDLQQRLAAAILVSEQQAKDDEVQITPIEQAPIPVIETITPDNSWSVGMKWFSGSLLAALIIGFIAGISWLDKRSRQRHGGFRIY